MSKAPSFNSVPSDLAEHAQAVWRFFRTRGYEVAVEPQGKLHFPNTPAMVCSRTHTEIEVLVFQKIDIDLVKAWIATAKNTKSDFRVAICVPPSSAARDLKDKDQCRKLGVGIYESTTDEGIVIVNEPQDQGIQIALPDLSKKPAAVRKALGSALDHLDAHRWREGFEEACKCLEQKARPYLKRAVKNGRLTVRDGRNRVVTEADVERMTLGQMAHALDSAPQKNQADDMVMKALKAINPDRVKTTHKNKKKSTETRLRSSVGLHLLTIIRAVEELCK